MEVSDVCGRIVSVCPGSPMIVVRIYTVVVVAGPAMPIVGEASVIVTMDMVEERAVGVTGKSSPVMCEGA